MISTMLGDPLRGLSAEAPRFELWHVGFVVADIEAALRDGAMMGGDVRSPVARLTGDTYDAQSGAVVSETLDVAFVSAGDGRGAIELISPLDPAGDGPQARFLAQRPGPTHCAYWCDDLIGSARWLVERGARLVLAPLAGQAGEERAVDFSVLDDLLAASLTCYLQLQSGVMVELNPLVSRDRMAMVWGEGIADVVLPPRRMANPAC